MTRTDVQLGFEVGTGAPVSIPLRHLVITGQTQEAGKTTALEALVARSGVKAVAFITKRGEGSFTEARIIRPYFREQADWQFVASILEASRSEKMRFERPWIIRASKGAKSLADVHRNVKKALESAKGMNADLYLVLDAYLEAVVPQIERVRWADRVELGAGVNAMDLTALNVEMQHLVIRSTIDWVLHREQDTVVVVPEAWKFIPQGRGTPVKLGAEAFIRQAAALRNYLWLDSQDIAGVEKMILKSVPVWILGVQRESNEVKRTLAQIPAGIKKPKPEAVATLGLGEFYACYGSHITKVYAQPAWMSEDDARAVALGDTTLQRPQREEKTVNEREARAIRAENVELKERVVQLERQLGELSGRTVGKQGAKMPEARASGRDVETPRSPSPATPPGADPSPPAAFPSSRRNFDGTPQQWARDDEEFYQALKVRLAADAPALLKVLSVKPELEVTVERRVITADGESLRGRLARLIADGFFDDSATGGQVQKEFERGAYAVSPGSLYPELENLCRFGFLVIEEGKDDRGRARRAFRAVAGMKVNILETPEPAYR